MSVTCWIIPYVQLNTEMFFFGNDEQISLSMTSKKNFNIFSVSIKNERTLL